MASIHPTGLWLASHDQRACAVWRRNSRNGKTKFIVMAKFDGLTVGSSDWDLYKVLRLPDTVSPPLLHVVAVFWPHPVDPSTVVVVYQHHGIMLVCMVVRNPDAQR
jgi:hypothetical protein